MGKSGFWQSKRYFFLFFPDMFRQYYANENKLENVFDTYPDTLHRRDIIDINSICTVPTYLCTRTVNVYNVYNLNILYISRTKKYR